MTKVKLANVLAVIALTAACMISSCSRGTPPTAEDVDLGEEGTWTWVMSTGGRSGNTIYADSVSYTRQLAFDSDSSYLYTRNFQIESAGKYLLVSETAPGGSATVWVVKYSDNLLPSDVIERIDADTLVLSQTVVDGYTGTFAR